MGHVVGISKHCGHALTFKVLNASTLKVVHCSLLCPSKPDDPSLCAKMLGGENKDVIQSQDDIYNNLLDSKHLSTLAPPPIVDPEELIVSIFLIDAQPDGSQFCSCIVKMIEDHDYKLNNKKNQIKLLLSTNEDTSEEVITIINSWTTWQKMTIMASYGKSSVLFHIKDLSLPNIIIIKDQNIISWWNGRMGQPQWNHCRSLQRITP
jgi:hypothetical protein